LLGTCGWTHDHYFDTLRAAGWHHDKDKRDTTRSAHITDTGPARISAKRAVWLEAF
jgi:hypothetical protein